MRPLQIAERSDSVNDSGFLFEEKKKIYTVSELNEEIKRLLETSLDFIWVEGEISNFRAPVSGHYYMALKDERTQIKAVMFRPQSSRLRFKPEDGMKVLAQGRVGVYEPRGEYQIVLDYLEPLGVGALALAFEQLKRKLAAQGLFDAKVKKPLPFLPQRVAVITSPTGAAVRDFLKVITRRFANIEIVIVPVKVQGDEAAREMVEALERVNRDLSVDVIVLTRGGGSLEDLWAFNDEELAHAIRASHVPVVSAVGHEVDLTISDLAADLRAPTPSAAAELLVAEKESLKEELNQCRSRLVATLKFQISNERRRVGLLARGLRDPRRRLADSWLRLDESQHRLVRLIFFCVREKRTVLAAESRSLLGHSPLTKVMSLRQKLDFQRRALTSEVLSKIRHCSKDVSLVQGKLKEMSPLAVLRRGYAIALKMPQRLVLRSASDVGTGDRVTVTLAEGELKCRVEEVVR